MQDYKTRTRGIGQPLAGALRSRGARAPSERAQTSEGHLAFNNSPGAFSHEGARYNVSRREEALGCGGEGAQRDAQRRDRKYRSAAEADKSGLCSGATLKPESSFEVPTLLFDSALLPESNNR